MPVNKKNQKSAKKELPTKEVKAPTKEVKAKKNELVYIKHGELKKELYFAEDGTFKPFDHPQVLSFPTAKKAVMFLSPLDMIEIKKVAEIVAK